MFGAEEKLFGRPASRNGAGPPSCRGVERRGSNGLRAGRLQKKDYWFKLASSAGRRLSCAVSVSIARSVAGLM